MINQVSYDIETIDGPRHITITPVISPISEGVFYATGVFKLSDGVVGMGDITFDDQMDEWEYDGIDALSLDEAGEIADFIRDFKDPEGADPALL